MSSSSRPAARWCATSSSSGSTAKARWPSVRGATLLKGRQHADVTLVADHTVPGCTSRELFKSVLDGEARGIFQGKIIVRRKRRRPTPG